MTKNSSFVSGLSDSVYSNKTESVLQSLFREYEKVIVRSIITSFGLDLLFNDLYGGDVDTIHNVRLIGIDQNMKYKNSANRERYELEKQTPYRHDLVTRDKTNYQRITSDANKDRLAPLVDAYENKEIWRLGNSANAPSNLNAELDHVIAVKTIYEDRGRILANESLVELADSENNLKWTNKRLNASMGEDEIPDYISKHPELADDVKSRMMESYSVAKEEYERTINNSYYHSKKFYHDTATAAINRGIQMGLRQAVGFLLAELWFDIKDKLEQSEHSITSAFGAVKDGLTTWSNSIVKEYPDFIALFGQGVFSGIVSSFTSTLMNTFVTTSQTVNKIIREGWASIVEAVSILMFDKEDEYLCDRISNAAKVIATGASVVIGTVVQEKVSTKLHAANVNENICEVVSTFAGCFSTGVLSVSLLFYIDYNPFDSFLNSVYGSQLIELEKQKKMFLQYCAELEKIDIDQLERETKYIKELSDSLRVVNDDSLALVLKQAQEDLDLKSPWGEDSLDNKMLEKTWTLQFE